MPARMRQLAWIAAAPLVASSLLIGGCANQKAGGLSIEGLQAENQELRERNDLVEQALNDAEARNADLTAENSDLATQLNGLGSTRVTGFEATGATITSRNQDIVVTVAGDVLFASGSADLKGPSKRTLDGIAQVLRTQYAGHDIEIAGHTDTDAMRKTKAQWTDNENLSAQRALAVERFLASKGVDQSTMHISGFGPSAPKATKRDSRRVEIVVLAN